MSFILKIVVLFAIIALFQCVLEVRAAETAAIPRSIGLNVVLGEKQYYVGITQKLNWYRASQICAARGMTLTSIESEDEYKNLSNYLFANSLLDAQFWLSGSDLALAREHTWLATGNKFSYTKWANGQPATNNAANRCVLTNAVFSWVTANCATENYFICSRPVVPSCGAMGSCLYTYSPL